MDFINLTHPSQTAQLRRQAYSIAARATHARRRQARMAAWAATDGLPSDEQPQYEVDVPGAAIKPSAVDLSRRAVSSEFPPRRPSVSAWQAHLLGSSVHLHAGRKDPFASACVSFTWRDHFVLDQYITVVVPYFSGKCGVLRSSKEYGERMKTHWVRMALDDEPLLGGLFLLTYRFLNYVRQQREYHQPAIYHKIKCLQAMKRALTSPDVLWDDSTVALALILTLDEIIERDFPSASIHVAAAQRVINLRGGARAIGLSSYNAAMLHGYIHDKHLLDPAYAAPCGEQFMYPET